MSENSGAPVQLGGRPSLLQAARGYAALGWLVIPCAVGGKPPLLAGGRGWEDGTTDLERINRWWSAEPRANVGIVVGPGSGVSVLDIDPRNGGDTSFEQLAAEFGPLPATPMVRTGGGGRRYYFRHDPRARNGTLMPGVELKAGSGYVIAPPSAATGPYRWAARAARELAPLPQWLLGLRARTGIIAMADTSSIKEGSRNQTLTSLAGTMRVRGMTAEAIHVALLAENRTRCNPPLSDREVEKIARSVARYPATDFVNASVRKPGWPDPLDPAAYHGLAGEFVHMIAEHTESDLVALLVQFLVGFGNLVGREPYFAVEADRHHANEFALLVGESSRGRKGTAWGNARRPLRAVDPEWADTRHQSGLSSGEGLIWAVRDPIQARSAIREKGRVVGYEDVEEDPGVADKRLQVVEPEFASTLRVMGREGSTLSAVVRQAWDSGDLRVLTKKSPAKATGAHISVIGHVTVDELLRYLDRTEAANGFINRFLIVCVRRARILPEGGRIHEIDFRPLFDAVGRAVEWGRVRAELKRDEAARALWFDVYEELSEGRPGLLGAVVSRAEAHVVRLSLLYALLDGADRIGRPHLEAALAVWRYAEASARYVFGGTLGDPVADELLNALRARPDGLTRTEISAVVFGRNRAAGEIARALNALAARGLACFKREETAGRAAERWYAVRATKETNETKEAPEGEDPISSSTSHSSLENDSTSDGDSSSISSNSSNSSLSVESENGPDSEEATWIR